MRNCLPKRELCLDSFFFQHFKYVTPVPSGLHGFWLEMVVNLVACPCYIASVLLLSRFGYYFFKYSFCPFLSSSETPIMCCMLVHLTGMISDVLSSSSLVVLPAEYTVSLSSEFISAIVLFSSRIAFWSLFIISLYWYTQLVDIFVDLLFARAILQHSHTIYIIALPQPSLPIYTEPEEQPNLARKAFYLFRIESFRSSQVFSVYASWLGHTCGFLNYPEYMGDF